MLLDPLLYYSLIIIVFVHLFAIDLRILQSKGIALQPLLGFEANSALRQICACAFSAFILWTICTLGYYFSDSKEIFLFLLVICALCAIVWPFETFFFGIAPFGIREIIFRCINPPGTVPFVDVLIADGLMSLSKCFGELIGALFFAARMPKGLITVALVQCIPSIIRIRQCLVSRREQLLLHNPVESQVHLKNAAKYLTTISVILADTLMILTNSSFWTSIWIFCSLAHTFFNVYWDTVMDWGLKPPSFRRKGSFDFWEYSVAVGINILLRSLWLSRVLNEPFFMIKGWMDWTEIFRRFMWTLVRVDWESIRISQLKYADVPQS